MSVKYESLEQKLARIDAHIITPEEYVEAPEMTDDDFLRGQFFHNGQPISREDGLKAFQEQIARGRPKLETTKVMTSIRLSPEVVSYFKAGGKGWQTRLDAALLTYIKTEK